MENKTIIVSNRLPLNVKINDNENVEITPSVGGLATGMASIHQGSESLWIGWTGVASDEINKNQQKTINQAIAVEKCVGVPLSNRELKAYYYGFSNGVLWPMFHYFMEYANFSGKYWESYKSVNEKFAKVVLENVNDGDKIWVHDYQLLLLPELIKKAKPEVSIGFFLHIPFPSFEIFRTIPWRKQLLKGMLGADLLGFHTYDYERHFISSVSRILRCEVDMNMINTGDRIVKVDSFPMGIDYEKFHQAAINHYDKKKEEKSEFQKNIEQQRKKEPDCKLILSIDRLDYTKGIANRIKAFEFFLEKYPQYCEKVKLIMLAVPSREEVPQYKKLKKEIDELVGRINGKFSTVNWVPVGYFYRSMPFEDLIDLYTSSEIALLTPIRDGMNLVAKEYLASRADGTGVLILSEMAGAAQEMSEALLINPNDYNQIAEAIKQAIEMPVERQRERNRQIQKRIKRYNVERWAADFMKALESVEQSSEVKHTKRLNHKNFEAVLDKFKQSKQKIFFLDYDGTMVNFHENPLQALPDDELVQILNQLLEQKIEIVIISGRDRKFLESQFGNLPVSIIAEHGVWTRLFNKEWVMNQSMEVEWMESIRPVIENFVDRTPGSFLEEKEFSLVWHYRKCDPGLGAIRTNELSNTLKGLLANKNISVLKGNKVLEIKNGIINKGNAAYNLLDEKHDFIFAIGDDWTDEYMFKLLPENTVTVKVGAGETVADYYLEGTEQAREILKKFGEN